MQLQEQDNRSLQTVNWIKFYRHDLKSLLNSVHDHDLMLDQIKYKLENSISFKWQLLQFTENATSE